MAPSARLTAFASPSAALSAVLSAAPFAAPLLASLTSLIPSLSSLPLTLAALSLSPTPSPVSPVSLAALPSFPEHSTASERLPLRFWRLAGSLKTLEASKPCSISLEAAEKVETTSAIARRERTSPPFRALPTWERRKPFFYLLKDGIARDLWAMRLCRLDLLEDSRAVQLQN